MIPPSWVISVGIGIVVWSIITLITLIEGINLFSLIIIPITRLTLSSPMARSTTISTRRVRVYRFDVAKIVNLLVEH